MTDATTDFDVPVEPVWYEASAVDEAAFEAVDTAGGVETVGAADAVEATARVVPPPPPTVPATPLVAEPPVSDDILPPLAPPPVVEEEEVETAPPAAPEEKRPPRQWRTVPVVGGLIAALLIGFVIGRVTDDGSSSNTSANRSSTNGGGTAGQPSAGAPQQASGNAPAPTPTSGAPGQINGNTVLLNIPRHTGPLITDHFTVTANRWVLGWAYDCTAQGGTGSFNITVFDGSGGPSKDGGIDQQGAKGSSVVAYTSTGERYLSVTTNCVWAIRVTT